MSVLDYNLAALITNTVDWERFNGADIHGDSSWLAPQAVPCWIEERGVTGGVEALRHGHSDVYDPLADLYFDATNEDVQEFDLRDRFTVRTITVVPLSAQPDRINLFRGPDGLPWIVVVTL